MEAGGKLIGKQDLRQLIERQLPREYESVLWGLVRHSMEAEWQEFVLANGLDSTMMFGTTRITYQILVSEADFHNLPEKHLRFYWRQELQPVFDQLFAALLPARQPL